MDADQVSVRRLNRRAALSLAFAQTLRKWGPLSGLLLAILVGGALRWPVLFVNRFHEDEALYSTWALRIATGLDPWLEGVLVDKPPLFPYLLAGLFRIWDASEVVARLPGFAAGLASIVCIYGLARQLYSERVALLGAWLLALSPFHISFSGTAFMDPVMVCWVLASLWAAAAGRFLGAGLMLGLAASTKQQGLLFIPLILALGLLMARGTSRTSFPPRGKPRRVHPLLSVGGPIGIVRLGQSSRRGWDVVRMVVPLVAGFALPMGVTTWWDAHRWWFRPSYFDRSLAAYGGMGLLPVDEILDQARSWFTLVGYIGTTPWNNWLFAAAAGVLALVSIGKICASHGRVPVRKAQVDLLWILFGVGYLAVHCFVNFQPWDRYLLPLVPLTSLVIARAAELGWQWLEERVSANVGIGRAAVCSVFVILGIGYWGPATDAANSRLPLGADRGAYDGIGAVTGWLLENVDGDVPVHHRWLGWHLAYYLFGREIDHHWYPAAESLVEEVAGRQEAFLVAPSWRSISRERIALARVGRQLVLAFRARGREEACAITVYRITMGAPPALSRPGGPCP